MNPHAILMFVVEKLGDGTAYHVGLELELEECRSKLLVWGDYDKKLPIPVLRGGGRVELIAALSQGTGVVFEASWRWRKYGGKVQQRQKRICPTKA